MIKLIFNGNEYLKGGVILTISLNSASFNGINGFMVNVEVDISKGMPSFNIVGLPDVSIKEAKERVRLAIINSGFEFPLGRITVNLAPASLKKVGSLFDLPLALGILAESNQIDKKSIEEYIAIGELSLNGEIRAVEGAFCCVVGTMESKKRGFILPYGNCHECSVLDKVKLYGFSNLKEVINFLDTNNKKEFIREKVKIEDDKNIPFFDICGQESAKKALVISASGKHNLIFQGPPGSGKTMLAKSIIDIMPKLTYKESLESAKIYSVSGNFNKENIIGKRPFRNPHHTTTKISLLGGGRDLRVGEVTLAHNGVLFLDELLEFDRGTIESLREPLENKEVRISRNSGSVKYPSDFLFIGAFNPCPCGNYLSGINGRECTCRESERIRYQNRLSKAILDRIDMFSFVNYVSYKEINANKHNGILNPKEMVMDCRERQEHRFKNTHLKYNSQMSHKDIRNFIKINEECHRSLEKIYNKTGISTRGLDRIIKLSVTIMDLNKENVLTKGHIYEAISYRKNINGEVI